MKIIIISANFFDFNSNTVEIGGLETYVRDLAQLCHSSGHDVTVVQMNPKYNDGDRREFNGITISNLVAKSGRQKIVNDLEREYPQALFILASDQFSVKLHTAKALQIQHGIAFDIPGNLIPGFWGKTRFLQSINKTLRCWKNVKRFKQAPLTVCVDYNYYNWFRTLGSEDSGHRMTVIPNYANRSLSEFELEDKLSKFDRIKRVVFARRFVDYRGTRLFANVIERILKEQPDLEVTFAGSGPLEEELKTRFQHYSQVKFDRFDSAHSLEFHRRFDLAIVPTIFSEGTSLSLCEAMAAGCMVIATHVGGMTNIILDEYNGYLVYPGEQELYDAIKEAMSMNRLQYAQMVKAAHQCANSTFSKSHWDKKWLSVISSFE